MTHHDIVIRGGTVIDGSGGEPTVADVLVDGGAITAVGSFPQAGGHEEIDARGLIVTPGFVDVHTHYDGQATWEQRMKPSSGHGVTTVVMGNCGVGFAPCRAESRDELVQLMEGIEDIPEVVMTAGLPWAWQTFPDYLDFLGGRQFDIDVAAQLPHAALRVYAMGSRGARRDPATPRDMADMQSLAREAMEAGAIGFATSRSVNHRGAAGTPTPSFEAAEQELHAIAQGVAQAGKGVLQVITDFPSIDAVPERMGLLRSLAERSGRPLSFTLAQFHSSPRAWPAVLEFTERARAEGLPMKGQVFPRPMGLLMGLETTRSPFMSSALYRQLATLPHDDRVEAMRDPARRATIIAQGRAAPDAGKHRNYDFVFPLRRMSDYEPTADLSLSAQAAATGMPADEIAYDLMMANHGRGMMWAAFANLYDGNLEAALAMLRSEATIVGLGDGGAHYGLICDASYPTFMLAYWARDRTLGDRLPLPTVVKKLARDTALAMGLEDRGLLAPGHRADINIIDFEALQLGLPTVAFDLPSGGRRLTQSATGFRATMVAGQVTYRDGEATGALPGRLVRGPQSAGQR